MSYHGYAPVVKRFLLEDVAPNKPPALLEVGVDRGVMMIPLVAFLARTRPAFGFIGVDVKVQEQVVLMLSNLDLQASQVARCVEGNSLDVLPKFVEHGAKFDVLLLDGDHNYHTVSRELGWMEDLTHPGSLVICDDYDGRWAERDLWYAEREDYVDVKGATLRVETEKHGVKAAVDEWLATHPEWRKSQPIKGEPVVLRRER